MNGCRLPNWILETSMSILKDRNFGCLCYSKIRNLDETGLFSIGYWKTHSDWFKDWKKINPLLIHWCQSHKIIKGIFQNYNVLIAKIVLPNETIRKWDNSFYWMWGKSWLSNQKTSTSLIHFSFPCDKTIKYLELIKLHRHKTFDVKTLEDITRN